MGYKKTEEGWELNQTLKMGRVGVFYETTTINGKEVCTLHKHGPLPEVAAAFEIWKKLGLSPRLNLVDATLASEEDLNHVIETCLLSPKYFERLVPIDMEKKKNHIKKILSGPENPQL